MIVRAVVSGVLVVLVTRLLDWLTTPDKPVPDGGGLQAGSVPAVEPRAP
jgi:hypothetical protein